MPKPIYETVMDNCRCAGGAVGRVTAGDLTSGPHASTYVCRSETHQAAAREWARAQTGGLKPEFVPFGDGSGLSA